MPDATDIELLRDYSERSSENAFAALVERHINLVYSAALRHAGNPAHAEEIAQAVFVILARKAASLRPNTVLEAWLYETTRLTSLSFLRGEWRRQRREQEAYMQSTLQEPDDAAVWNQLAPLLDDAMARLAKKDREALVLRFFKGNNLRGVATAMNISETAAQSRVHRAIEKLRHYFSKNGVHSTTAIIAGEISGHSVHAAPAGLGKAISVIAVTKGVTASASTLTLIKGALKIMAWTKAKTAVVIGAGILLGAGTTTIVATKIVNFERTTASPIYEKMWSHPNSGSLPLLAQAPPILIVRPTHHPLIGGGMWNSEGKGFTVNTPVSELIAIGYSWDPLLTIYPDRMPGGNYDLMENLPKGQNGPALRDEIKKQFGLVAHTEMRPMDMLWLTTGDDATLESHRSRGAESAYMTGDSKMQYYHFKNISLAKLASSLEGFIRLPLVAPDAPPIRYNFEFQWADRLRGADRTAAISNQLSQFGIVLIPTNMLTKVLVVEKAD